MKASGDFEAALSRMLASFDGYACDGCGADLVREGEGIPSSRWRYVDGAWQHACVIESVPGAGHIGRAVPPASAEATDVRELIRRPRAMRPVGDRAAD